MNTYPKQLVSAVGKEATRLTTITGAAKTWRSSSPHPAVGLLVAAIVLSMASILSSCTAPSSSSDTRWLKGNLHTHSLWSDGDQFPEAIATWYRDHDYDFLAISDHNTIAEGTKWVDVSPGSRHRPAFEALVDRFGSDAVSTRDSAGAEYARLLTFSEYRERVEQPGAFLLIRSEEITDRFGSLPIHMNASNIQELVAPQGGQSVRETMQRNLDVVARQREETGARIVPHINHPNFGWGITAEDLAFITGDKFFEVYNGHPAVHNEGDSSRYSTEEIWDYVLAARLERGMDVMYGIATDDAHNYWTQGLTVSNPGRGWVVVASGELTPDAVLEAMEGGRFYASSGVSISEIRTDGGTYSFDIAGQDGVDYRTRFIATRRGLTLDRIEGGTLQEGVGEIVGQDSSLSPTYTLKGDELYVRAVVTSSKLKSNPYQEGEFEQAWLQPIQN